ncbi:ECF transporter S component [Mycoplasma sp. P36-A1]|uniref:ECF transporter S component n=1 Tax=Mycoplasma sp. P36-A1 TaxID=3252900 RepID=UPI003C2CE121
MKNTRIITIGAMFMAIILVMALVPYLGYIQINLVAVTIIHIPVLIGSMAFKNVRMAIICGTTFGVSSWIVAMTRPSSPTDFIFQNPLVSILPRILFALLAFYLFVYLMKKVKSVYAASLTSTIIACIFHTCSVLGMMYLFGDKSLFPGGFFNLLLGVVAANGWIEVVLAAIVVPPVVKALGGLRKI